MNLILYIGFVPISTFLHSAIHETGHLIGGVLSEHHFLSFHLLSIKIEKISNKIYVVLFDDEMYSQCVMIPNKGNMHKYILYNLSGIMLNMIFTFVSLSLLLVVNNYVFSFLSAFSAVGLVKVVCNSIPINDKRPSDMQIIMWLLKSSLMRQEYFQYMVVYESYFYWYKDNARKISPTPVEKKYFYTEFVDNNTDKNYSPFFANEINKIQNIYCNIDNERVMK